MCSRVNETEGTVAVTAKEDRDKGGKEQGISARKRRGNDER